MGLVVDITKELRSPSGKFVLRPKFEAGDGMTVFFGPSASGKTGTLKCVAGLLTPDQGVIKTEDRTFFDSAAGVNMPARRRNVGYVFQDLALFPHMTVFDNVAYGLRSLTRWARRSAVEEILELARLDNVADSYPKQLSGGQRQRVALARALVVRPSVLLMDEPFTALDTAVKERLRADIVRIQSNFNIPSILVTHDLQEAFELGARLVIFDRGSVLQVGSRDEVFYHPANKTVARFVGTKNIFSGKVKSASKGEAVVETEGFQVVCPAANGIAAGDKVEFCIRPEEVMVIRPDKALGPQLRQNIFTGTVVGAVHLGETYIIRVKLVGGGRGGYDLTIKLPSHAFRRLRLRDGSEISVSLKKSALHLFSLGGADD